MKVTTLNTARFILLLLAFAGFGKALLGMHETGDVEYHFITVYTLFAGLAISSKLPFVEKKLLS